MDKRAKPRPYEPIDVQTREGVVLADCLHTFLAKASIFSPHALHVAARILETAKVDEPEEQAVVDAALALLRMER